MNTESPKYVTHSAIQGLIHKLQLPPPHEFSQDWEYEVSDASRIAEFLYSYEHMELNREEKFALMIIIISSLDDVLASGEPKPSWYDSIRHDLLQDLTIHQHTIYYWSMLDEEDVENCFAVTPFMREIAYEAKLDEISHSLEES